MATSGLAVLGLALVLFCAAVWMDPRAARRLATLLDARASAVFAAREAYRTTWRRLRSRPESTEGV